MPPVLAFGPFRFEPGSGRLFRDGGERTLPPRASAVLQALLERAGAVVPREQLLQSGWPGVTVTDASLHEAVSVVRVALEDDAACPIYVQTLARRGYRFIAPVTRHETARPGRIWLPWRSWAALLAVGAALAATRARSGPPPPDVLRTTVVVPAGQWLDVKRDPILALSPDGGVLAWVGTATTGRRLLVRRLDDWTPRELAGTTGATMPFFSPDGAHLGYVSNGTLFVVALAGGPPRRIAAAADAAGGAWTADDRIVLASSGRLLLLDPELGAARPLLEPAPGERLAWPDVSEDGQTVYATVLPAGGTPEIVAIDRASRTRKRLGAGTSPRACDYGLVFVRDGRLIARSWDDVGHGAHEQPLDEALGVTSAAQIAVARSGTIAFIPDDHRRDSGVFRVDLDGHGQRVPGLPSGVKLARPSPDGRRAALVVQSGERSDVWVADLVRGRAASLTTDGLTAAPVWTADGDRLLVSRLRRGVFRLYSMRASPGTTPEALPGDEEAGDRFATAMTADGSILFEERRPASWDVGLLAAHDGSVRYVLDSPANERWPRLAADGLHLSWHSDARGRDEVYVGRLESRGRDAVCVGAGAWPAWSGAGVLFRSGHELRYAHVRESAAETEPSRLFDDPRLQAFEPMDGRALLAVRSAEGDELRRIHLVRGLRPRA